MTTFKKLSAEELAKLDPTAQAKYQANLQAYEAEQAKTKEEAEAKAKEDAEAKAKAEADKKAKAEAEAAKKAEAKKPKEGEEASDEVADADYLNKKEIEELKANNPTLKEFFITSDKTAFPNRWLAENHNSNRKLDDVIQHIKR